MQVTTRRAGRTVLAALVVACAAGGVWGQQKVFEMTGTGWEAKAAAEPGSDAAVIAGARKLLAEGEASKAIDILDTWIEANETTKNPNLPEALLVRGDAILEDGNEFEALYDYERITQDYAGSEYFVRALEREFEVAKLYLGGLRKKSLGLFRIDSGIPIAEEIIMRINERLPGSRLAERAMLALADYYYEERDLRMAAESYDVFLTLFPRSEFRQKAMQRRVYSNIAQFKGPSYDASGLVEAKYQAQRYQTEYPVDAERSGLGEVLTARLDEQTARQLLEVAEWYEKRGDPPSQRLTLQRLLRKHPQSGAAQIATEVLTKNGWPLEAPVKPRVVPGGANAKPDVKPDVNAGAKTAPPQDQSKQPIDTTKAGGK
ncbi:MAG: outer membrane protein assembly factor BamD [Planctomycetota bacterium]|nr:outer membrane protein assembly factor BamD [Planctomycetota bacterium]